MFPRLYSTANHRLFFLFFTYFRFMRSFIGVPIHFYLFECENASLICRTRPLYVVSYFSKIWKKLLSQYFFVSLFLILLNFFRSFTNFASLLPNFDSLKILGKNISELNSIHNAKINNNRQSRCLTTVKVFFFCFCCY